MFDGMNVPAMLARLGDDPDIAKLFGGPEVFADLRAKQALTGEARLRVAQAALDVFNSDAGQILFDHLLTLTFRNSENISLAGLRMDQAIQAHAEMDGRKAIVAELFRLVKEAQNPPHQPKA